MADDTSGPRFSAKSAVYFDDLDAFGMLYYGRYAALVEHGITALLAANGFKIGHEDTFNVLREFQITFEAPIRSVGEVDIDLWSTRTSRSSHTFGFAVKSGDVEHARGLRTATKVDPTTGRSKPWSDEIRAIFGVPSAMQSASSPQAPNVS